MAIIKYSNFLKGITIPKTDNFTADGPNGTVYIAAPESADLEILLEASEVETRYTFVNASEGFDLRVFPATDETIKFWDVGDSQVDTVTDSGGEYLQVRPASSIEIIKSDATNWTVVFGNGFRLND